MRLCDGRVADMVHFIIPYGVFSVAVYAACTYRYPLSRGMGLKDCQLTVNVCRLIFKAL